MMLLTLAVVMFGLGAPVSFAKEVKGKSVEVELKDTSGKKLGVATLHPLTKGVGIHLEVSGLSPGVHAMHFHEKGECKAPDFKSAGGHFNPAGTEHGLENAKGPHAGDMANFQVREDGTAKIDVKNEAVSLGKGKNSLFQAGGTALVIHSQADDNKSQPAGNAGARTACGEIHGG